MEHIEQYFKEHAITREIINKYGLTWSQDRITIPIKNKLGQFLFNKYRLFNAPMKYQYDTGSSMQLFNAEKITPEIDRIWIVEGEFDAMVTNESNPKKDQVSVSSTGGAGSWNERWNELFVGKKVGIVLDRDDAGVKGAVRIWKELAGVASQVGIYMWEQEDVKDGCDMVAKYGEAKVDSVIRDRDGKLSKTFKMPDSLERRKLAREIITDIHTQYGESDWDIERKYYNEFLSLFVPILHPKILTPERMATGEDIQSLKKIPITNFIDFHAGVANCIFHNDSHPSMHYNDANTQFPNTVKCFSCGKFADVIDVVMQLNDCKFKEALEILKKQ